MAAKSHNLVVVGQGAAGLSAALSAAQTARERGLPLNVTLVEKASAAEAGGNTRWTPAYMRMAAPDRVETGFVHDMLAATGFQGDETYFARLAADAPSTIAWIRSNGVEFHQPVYYLAKGPPRIQPVGGGEAIHRVLTQAAAAAGVDVSLFVRGGEARRRRCRRAARSSRSRRAMAGRPSSRPMR